LRRHQQLIRDNYSGEPGSITVNWMKAIIGLQIAEFVIKIVLSDKLTRLSGVNLSIVSNTFCFILETFLLVVFCIWQKSIPLFIPASELSEEVIQSTEILQHYFRKLEQFMAEQKPYLDPELTIEKLSIQVNIRKAMLSQVLNKGINKNFFTFIREYRVQHAIQLLQLAGQHQTIIVIAYESGFNSKTAFHRAFKEVTGKTPSEFQQLSD
jgi:AraC-like DNA-binding protein